MRRVALVFAVLVLLPAYASSDGRGAAAAKARLQAAALKPLVVVGTGFRAGENVRVTANAEEGFAAKSGRAGSAGRIGVRFPKLNLGRCSTYLISAKGDKGSRIRASSRT